MLLVTTSSNWNPKKNKNKQENQKPHQQQLQNLHYKRTEIRARAVGKKDDASLGSPRARQPTAKRSGASQQRATQKLLTVRSACARELARRGRGNRDSRLVDNR
jgi:hypothetical protein